MNNLATLKAEVEAALPRFLPSESTIAQPVIDAMHHAVLGGGKRLRPSLVLMSCEAFGSEVSKALDAALAVEVFHNFSLLSKNTFTLPYEYPVLLNVLKYPIQSF